MNMNDLFLEQSQKKKEISCLYNRFSALHAFYFIERQREKVGSTHKAIILFFYRRCCCFVAVVVSLLSSRKKTEGKTSKSWKRINYMLGVVVVIAMFSRILFFLLLLVHTHTH